MSPLASSSACPNISDSLNWSYNRSRGPRDYRERTRLHFGEPWDDPTSTAFQWYNAQPLRQFRTIQYCKELAGVQHEFVLLLLHDAQGRPTGSVCRLERTADPSHQIEAIGAGGTIAYDFAQIIDPTNSSDTHGGPGTTSSSSANILGNLCSSLNPGNRTQPSDKNIGLLKLSDRAQSTSAKSTPKYPDYKVLAEIEFTSSFDLRDILAICYGISSNRSAHRYTLQQFNCYFFSWAITLSLTRSRAGWEQSFARQWQAGDIQKRVCRSIREINSTGKKPVVTIIDEGMRATAAPGARLSLRRRLQKHMSTPEFFDSLLGALISMLWQGQIRASIQPAIDASLRRLADETWTLTHPERILQERGSRVPNPGKEAAGVVDHLAIGLGLEMAIELDSAYRRSLSQVIVQDMDPKSHQSQYTRGQDDMELRTAAHQRTVFNPCDMAVGLVLKATLIGVGLGMALQQVELEWKTARHYDVHGRMRRSKIYGKAWLARRTLQQIPASIRLGNVMIRELERVARQTSTTSQNDGGADPEAEPTGLWSRLERLVDRMDAVVESTSDRFSSDLLLIGESIDMLATRVHRLSGEHQDWDPATIQTLANRALLTMMDEGGQGWQQFWTGVLIHDLSHVEAEVVASAITSSMGEEVTSQEADNSGTAFRCELPTARDREATSEPLQHLQDFIRARISQLSKYEVENVPIAKYIRLLDLTTSPSDSQKEMEDALEDIWRACRPLMGVGRVDDEVKV